MMVGMVACGTADKNDGGTDSQETTGTPEADNPSEKTQFVLTYPESMTAQGYQSLVLEEIPTRIVCTATAPVPTLYAMGASLIAIPTSSARSICLRKTLIWLPSRA